MPATEDTVVEALRDVADPCCRERGISVVDMGLLEHVNVAEGSASIEIVLTSGWCPFQVDLLREIEDAVRDVPGIGEAEVSITFAETWSPQRLSASAREKLQFLPEPRQVSDRAAYAATQAQGSGDALPRKRERREGGKHDDR